MVVLPKYKENKTTTNYNNTIKDAPSLCDKTMLIEKQKVDVCKPSGVLISPSLWFSPFLNGSWRSSSNSYEKTSTQRYLPSLFLWGDISRHKKHDACRM
jgi:hypothetical protein